MPSVDTVASLGALLVAVVVAAMHGRSAWRTQKLQNEMTGATIALSFAKDVDARLRALEEFHTEVSEWWTVHAEWDRVRDRELQRLDPMYVGSEPKPFPKLHRTEPRETGDKG